MISGQYLFGNCMILNSFSPVPELGSWEAAGRSEGETIYTVEDDSHS
jgi:hypothetical protein